MPGEDENPGAGKDKGKDDRGKGKLKNGNDNQLTKGKTEGRKLPKTATATYSWILAGLVLLLAGLIVFVVQRKRRSR
ncbi:LPXTG cell wall anchor domain-containing protein [Oceanobacillus sp. APA_J-5(13-2)]|nr:LPXTG cell wall anchor domain-containing protein [Oceanobacillus alkalisoli]MCG5103943.1 LPXTG cell wall anchor domain-containing protein [Oceanobacillus alkalisoli]